MTNEEAINVLRGQESAYWDTLTEAEHKAFDLAVDALTAKQPRVLTLEEVAAAQKTPVWRETKRAHKDLYNGWMLAYDIQRGQGITGTRQGMTEPNGRIGWYKLDDYGKTWRCWTSKPTDEQREAVKWDG